MDEDWERASIVDAAGRPARILGLQNAGPDALAWVRAGAGPQVLVPLSLLARQADHTYRLPFSFADPEPGEGGPALRVPVLQEELRSGKRSVDSGSGVRIHKTVREDEELVEQILEHDEVEIARIPVGTIVAEENMPQARREGETLIVPILEEVLIVQKQLRLKEELHITRRKRTERASQTVTLKSEQVRVERFGDDDDRT